MTNSNSVPARVVIVAATDGSPASKEAMMVAGRFAKLAGSELHIVHVVDEREASTDTGIEAAVTILERAARDADAYERAILHVPAGVAWRSIVDLAAELQADVVVVGTHDRGAVGRAVLGSVAEQVMRHAGCPVFVARPKAHAGTVPRIEAPCPTCLASRQSTNGATQWCERHSAAHARGRLHYEFPQGFTAGSSQFIRTP